jgi:NADP-dependent 3-hydroxy acid dehydrogenase YdfG
MPVIFVTGATSGFGAATARLFARNGWKVIATGRRVERLEALRDEFPAGQIHIARIDLTERPTILKAVEELPDDFKPVMCLFNNGGLALGSNPIPDARLEDWEQMIDTNIKGLINTTTAVLPLLKAAGRGVTVLEPGMAKSEFTKVRSYGDDAANEKFYEGVEPILPENIADIVWFVANQPPHININVIEVMPTVQIPTRLTIVR